MSRNIKEIGKELLGKSLNSFHRKTGLTQLEKNNEMQDGILDGILSQVDDAYIEKTEQSNVIHLDGSGDGVVVLDSIEGNTMVNLWDINKVRKKGQVYIEGKKIKIITTTNRYSNFFIEDLSMFKPNTDYTFVVNIGKNTLDGNIYITSYASSTDRDIFDVGFIIAKGTTGVVKRKLTTCSDFTGITKSIRSFFDNSSLTENGEVSLDILVLEGDWTNRELPPYFEGLQSSFEEHKEDNKYEIEILMNNKNLLDSSKYRISQTNGSIGAISNNILTLGHVASSGMYCEYQSEFIKVKEETAYSLSSYITEKNGANANHIMRYYDSNKNQIGYSDGINHGVGIYTRTFTTVKGTKYIRFCIGSHTPTLDDTLRSCKVDLSRVMLKIGDIDTNVVPYKSNKIKLLINEPLRSIDDIKDRLCVKDGKLTIERNTFLQVLNGQEIWNINDSLNTSNTTRYYTNTLTIPMILNSNGISDKIPYITGGGKDDMTCIYIHSTVNRIDIRKLNTDNRWTTLEELKTWLRNNNVTLVLKRLEPIYEEVLNEYGEPIILEGYENGTLYIDSTVLPTTTVRYTPKMESFKTLKEVENNNIMLTNDVNDNIIPYMMDVDLMIMEKEMALMSHKNIRKMEVLDMTSMQKRTQDMLERLIKGKTLTEQECKTRVTTYLNAGKITDEQAEELMLLIDEVYA